MIRSQLNSEVAVPAWVTLKSSVTASVSVFQSSLKFVASVVSILFLLLNAVLLEIISSEHARHGNGKLMARMYQPSCWVSEEYTVTSFPAGSVKVICSSVSVCPAASSGIMMTTTQVTLSPMVLVSTWLFCTEVAQVLSVQMKSSVNSPVKFQQLPEHPRFRITQLTFNSIVWLDTVSYIAIWKRCIRNVIRELFQMVLN